MRLFIGISLILGVLSQYCWLGRNLAAVISTQSGNSKCETNLMLASCNFDSKSGADLYLWKGYSDCYLSCLATGCPLAKLGDGICDPECSSNECGLDWGDCGYCAKGCTKSMLDDRRCNPACNNEKCGYDAGACIGYCAADCPESSIGNRICDMQCYTEACNYDRNRNITNLNQAGDCNYCSLENKSDGFCDVLCNNSVYNYDVGDCLCSKDCKPYMLGDGKCDYECLTPKCQYNDVHVCKECAPGCPIKPESCITECLTIGCSYLSGDFCSPVHKYYSLMRQLKVRDFRQTFDVESECLSKHPGCTLGYLYDSICQAECNNPDCLYDMYNCDTISGGKYCSVAHKSNYDECFKCQTVVNLSAGRSTAILVRSLYTACVGQCPIGFTTKRYDEYFICLFDASKYINPQQLYVAPDSVKIKFPRGTLIAPYLSISDAMSNIRSEKSSILMMKGEHKLKKIEFYDTIKMLIGENTPLNFFGELNPKRIEIKPLFCSITTHDLCVEDGGKVVIRVLEHVELDAVNTLIISNIIFIGEIDLTLGKCGPICGEFMYYCANIYYNSTDGAYYDDRNIKLPSPDIPQSKACTLYHDKYFLDVHATGNLIIQNSEFVNFRQELKAIIYNQGGNISLSNVNFRNIRVASSANAAVIYSMDCKLDYKCGSFEYFNGTVSLLNNGYEYSDNNLFAGFLAVKGMNKVSIQNVTFDKNLVYIGKSVLTIREKAIGVLMYIENFIEAVLKDLKFISNYIDDGLIKLINNQELPHELDEHSNLAHYYHDHITMENLEFYNNGAVNKLGIQIEMQQELLNIFLHNILLDNNFSRKDSFISISLMDSIYKDIWIYGGLSTVLDDQNNTQAYFPSRSLRLSDIDIYNSKSSSNFISLYNLANVEIQGISMMHNIISNEFEGFDHQVLSELIEDSSTYLQMNIQSESYSISNQAFVSMKNQYNLLFHDSAFSFNSGVTIINIDISEISCRLYNILLESNSNDSILSTGISLKYASDTSFSNFTCTNNINSYESGLGVIQVSSLGDYKFELSDSYFYNNSASVAGALALEEVLYTSIFNCTFLDNTAIHRAGSILIELPQMLYDATFILESCRFERSSSIEGIGGAIVIDNITRSTNNLILSISNSHFQTSFSEFEGSVLYISDRVTVHTNSTISNSTFFNNHSNNKGTIYLAYFSGILAVNNCSFLKNYNLAGMSIYFLNQNERQDEKAVLVLTNSSFSNHSGSSIINIESIHKNNQLISNSCKFYNNNSTAVHIVQGSWEDSYSEFRNNTSEYGAAAVLYDGARARLYGTLAEYNTAVYDGGAMYAFFDSVLECYNCELRYNRARMNGGAVYTQLNSKLVLNSCRLFSNYAEENGSLIFVLDSREGGSITSSSIYTNSAGKGGTIFILKSSMNIYDTEFYNNTSQEITAGIMMILATIQVFNSNFYAQTAFSGVFFHVSTNSNLHINNSNISNGSAQEHGGAIYSLYSKVYIEDSIISTNSAESGAVIYAYTSSSVIIKSSKIFDNSARYSGSFIDSIQSEVEVYSSIIYKYTNGAISGENLGSLIVEDSTFEYGYAIYGGAISCSRCYTISFHNNTFINNTASYGGAIYLSTARLEEAKPVYSLTNNSILRNSAYNGGGVYIEDVSVFLYKNIFDSNIAYSRSNITRSRVEDGIGGGIMMKCLQYEYCNNTLEDNSFLYNHAGSNGGAISWNDVMPVFFNNLYIGNEAIYGKNISSYPILFMFNNSDPRTMFDSKTQYLGLDGVPILAKFQEIASGQYNDELKFSILLIDHYYNLVSTDFTTQCEILPKDSSNTALTGQTKLFAKAGICSFDNLIISASPGGLSRLKISIDSIIPSKSIKARDGLSYISEAIIELNLRECTIGESQVGRDCVLCKAGEYSLDPKEECKICKECAVCYGNYTMVPKKGYWRSNKFTDVFFKCFNREACLGSTEEKLSFTGECEEGYTGNLCNSCNIGYSRVAKNVCSMCPEAEGNIFKIIGLSILASIAISIFVYTTMSSATKPKSLKSIYLKIILNHFQLVSIAASFNLDWPDMVRRYLQAQENIGLPTEQILSIDCLFASDSSSYLQDIQYSKLILNGVLPIAVLIICLAFWGITSCYHYSSRYLRRELIASIIILLFLLHPNLVKTMFSQFSCMEIDPGEYWLIDNLEIRCWDDTHTLYILSVALPSILIWGLGVPTISLYALYRNRRRLDEVDLKLKFAFLFNGYKSKYFYWEFVILYRKIILICCAVFLGNASVNIQALSVMLLLIISLYLQFTRAPYTYDVLNVLELRSILVVSTTIYSGLYFLTNDLGDEAKTFFFVMILASNAYFMYFWMWHVMIDTKLYKFIPYFSKKFFKTNRDTYNTQLFVSNKRKDPNNLNSLISETNATIVDEALVVPEEFYSKKFEMKDLYLEIVKYKTGSYYRSDSKYKVFDCS